MKTAVDTNVLVRFLTGDDSAGQASIARRAFERDSLVLVPTVILEAEWVLRKAYRFDRSMIDAAFSGLLTLPNVEFLCEDELILALDGLRNGMDFADAFHLAHATKADEFATFDRDFARRARSLSDAVPVRLL